jgi:hypothetical protein
VGVERSPLRLLVTTEELNLGCLHPIARVIYIFQLDDGRTTETCIYK